MFNISGFLYSPIVIWTIFALVMWYHITHVSSNGNSYLLKKQPISSTVFLTTVMILFLGFRPLHAVFADMAAYNLVFFKLDYEKKSIDLMGEWFMLFTMKLFKHFKAPVELWFATIELGYIGCAFWACKRLLRENVFLPMLFFFSSFSFFSYGTNTMRQGLAGSILLLGITFLVEKRKSWIGYLLMYLAFSTHRSMIISIASIFAAKYLVKNVKLAVVIWIGSIFISFFVGHFFMHYFEGFNFDDRVGKYSNSISEYKTGFRVDFLLYSAMPIITAWYAVVSKKVEDKTFNLLAISYILANAVWIQCIRVPFTDRFAYTSWFLYPFILAYAFVRLPLSKNQDSLVGWILLLQASFSLFMKEVLGK